MRRGEVWLAELGGAGETRPVLLVMHNGLYAARSLVIVAEITSRMRGLGSEVRLRPADGVREDSVVNLGMLLTIPAEDCRWLVTTLSAERMRDVDRALAFTLGMGGGYAGG